MEVMDASLEMSTGENNSIKLAVEEDVVGNSNPNCITATVTKEADDILNISNTINIVPEILKDADDIFSVSKSIGTASEDVSTRPRPRGRPKGSVRPASTNREIKGRENRAKTLAPFEKEGPLSREDVRCVICVSIFIEPVVLPCKHCLCLECYQTSMSQATLCCPICRFRLSNWGRKNTGNLIHKDFWKRIQAQFPEAVEARLLGQDSQSVPIFDSPTKPLMRDGCEAQDGEILYELEVIQKQHDADLENQKLKEAEASSEYIRQLQELEGPPPPSQSPSQLLRDYELAKKLQEEEEIARQAERARVASNSARNSVTASSKSTNKKKTLSSSRSVSNSKKRGNSSLASVTPTSSSFKRLCTTDLQGKQNKITNFFESTSAPKSRPGTPDSINLEFSQHFQPIVPAPKTPPKRNSDGSLEESVFVNSRPVRRDLSIDFGFVELNQTRSSMELTARNIEVARGFEECVLSENGLEPGLLASGNLRGSETGRPGERDKQINTSLEPKLDSTNEPVASSSFAKSPVECLPEAIREDQLESRNELEILMVHEDDNPRNPPGNIRTVEYYLEHSGSSDSVVMGSDESDDAEQHRRDAQRAVDNQGSDTSRARSPFPSDPDDSANSSEYEFNLPLVDKFEQERALALLKQEEEDRKFALKLQKEFDKPVVVREKYELRKSDDRKKIKYEEKDTSTATDGDSIYRIQPSSSGNLRSSGNSDKRAPKQKRATNDNTASSKNSNPEAKIPTETLPSRERSSRSTSGTSKVKSVNGTPPSQAASNEKSSRIASVSKSATATRVELRSPLSENGNDGASKNGKSTSNGTAKPSMASVNQAKPETNMPDVTSTSDAKSNNSSSGRRNPSRRRNVPVRLLSPPPPSSSSSSSSIHSMSIRIRKRVTPKRLPSSSSSSSSTGPPSLTPQKSQLVSVAICCEMLSPKNRMIPVLEPFQSSEREKSVTPKKPSRKGRKRFPSTSSTGSSTGAVVGSPTQDF